MFHKQRINTQLLTQPGHAAIPLSDRLSVGSTDCYSPLFQTNSRPDMKDMTPLDGAHLQPGLVATEDLWWEKRPSSKSQLFYVYRENSICNVSHFQAEERRRSHKCADEGWEQWEWWHGTRQGLFPDDRGARSCKSDTPQTTVYEWESDTSMKFFSKEVQKRPSNPPQLTLNV